MDLREEIIKAVHGVMDSGVVQETIKSSVEKTIKELIERNVTSWGTLGKQVEEAVKKSLAINQDALNLPSYNDAIIKIIRLQLETYTRDCIEKQITSNMQELLEPAPESIKLSEIIEQYRQKLHDECDEGEGGQMTCHIVETDHSSSRGYFYDVCLDGEPNKERRKCAIRMGLCKNHMHTSDEELAKKKQFKLYHLQFENQDLEKQLFVGPFHDFERSIFQMRAAETLIDMDCEDYDVDTHYGHHYD